LYCFIHHTAEVGKETEWWAGSWWELQVCKAN